MDLNKAIEKLNLSIPSRIDKITIDTLSGCEISMKRDDLIHPIISGNKWRKLKYHLKHYLEGGYDSITSFGGAYSNHLFALSHVCKVMNIPCTLFVRGDGYDPENTTLSKLKSDGSNLVFMDRTSYRAKEKAPDVQRYLTENGNTLIIPEGGSGPLSRKGLIEFCEELDWSKIDHLFVSAGTGATAAAIYSYIYNKDIKSVLHVVSALKGDFMRTEIESQLDFESDAKLKVYYEYHFGGYAKMPKELIDFSIDFMVKTDVSIDLVYNAKTAFAMFDLINKQIIKGTDQILFLNTGGLRY